MAFPDGSRNSLIPSFLYHFSSACQSLDSRRFASPGLPSPPAFQNTGAAAETAAGAIKSFPIPAPSEPGKIGMYSPAFYAACTAGGILSCGLTHMAVTPLDLIKCNMQGDDSVAGGANLQGSWCWGCRSAEGRGVGDGCYVRVKLGKIN